MKTMKQNSSFLTIAVASLAMGATQLHAGSIIGTVTLDADSGVYPGIGGGEFTAVTQTGPSYINNYAADATYSGGFETFCLETGVDFTPGTTYYYSLGNVTQPVPVTGTGSATPLSAGAAWLYSEFAKGTLSGFDYTYGSTRQGDDNLLQSAIWAFQGQSYGSYPYGGAGNTYYDEAVTALGGVTAATANYTGTSVEILQMWTGTDMSSGEAAQNQLVLVPDGGLTVALLGFALVGLQGLRRKLA